MTYKILWLSDTALSPTGYSNVTKHVLNGLTARSWNCTNIGHNYLNRPLSPPIRILGSSETINFKCLPGDMQAAHAQNLIEPYINQFKPDLFVILLDTFMCYPWLLNKNISCKSVFYFPTDGDPFPIGCDAILRKVTKPIAMSKFGRDQVFKDHGILADYIPHGVDSNKFIPYTPEMKMAARLKWNLPPDAFIMGNNFRNQGRKLGDRLLHTFARFVRKNPKSLLFLNCDPKDVAAHFDMQSLARRLNIQGNIRYTDMGWMTGLPEESIIDFYNMLDVKVDLTSGEGFGITTIESMSCQTPVVMTNYTTTKEIVMDHDAGIGVPMDNIVTGSWNVDRGFVSIDKAVEALQYLKDNPCEGKRMGVNGRKAVLEEYDYETKVLPMFDKKFRELIEK